MFVSGKSNASANREAKMKLFDHFQKKHYSYSVKKVLENRFGVDPLSAVEKKERLRFSSAETADILPLCWMHAHNESLFLFTGNRFLLDITPEEDCITYLYQEGETRYALLMFMKRETDRSFELNLNCVANTAKKWVSAGYLPQVLTQTVCINFNEDGSFFFRKQPQPTITTLSKLHGKNILLCHAHTCWLGYFQKLILLSAKSDIREYECLFSPEVVLTTGTGSAKKTVGSGILSVKRFFTSNHPVRTVLIKYKECNIHRRALLAGNKEVNITVNTINLISEVNFQNYNGKTIPDGIALLPNHTLTELIPALQYVRPLSISQIHGYAVQMTYADGSLRNYYLKMFDSPQIPEQIQINGYIFEPETLAGVTADSNGIRFPNGFTVASHLLYHHSHRQICPRITEKTVARVNGKRLVSKYILPPSEFKSHRSVQFFRGENGECFGPASAMLDADGKRTTDATFYSMEWQSCAYRISMEPTGKYGYLLKDGSWLAPPVYTSAKSMSSGCTSVTRNVDGKATTFLLTADGKEVPFPHIIDVNDFCFGIELAPFNAVTEQVFAPPPGYYMDYDGVRAGKWGFVNRDGDIVVQPQYVYAIGFYNGETRSVVAKFVDSKLCWGAIDKNGKEVIPCIYESLYTRWGDAFAFRRFGEEYYGVMDADGNVLSEPQFDYFESYDKEHRLLAVGDHEDTLGVYSLDHRKMILPIEFDCISFDTYFISCEISYTGKERYFDYSGKEIEYSEYESVSEINGLLRTRKNGKFGYMKPDGAVVIPNILVGGRVWDNDLELYQKGYFVTGKRNQYGFSSIGGREILPPRYSELSIYDDFLIASERTDANWTIRDTLFDYNGTPLLPGCYRNMSFDKKRNVLHAGTPFGTEHFLLVSSDKEA